jgi:CheY-like chemotaxis protein
LSSRKQRSVCRLSNFGGGAGVFGAGTSRAANSGTDLPVIFMTAIDNEASYQQAFDAGCIACLRKPFPAK